MCFFGAIANGFGIIALASQKMYSNDLDAVKQNWYYSYGYFKALSAARYYAAVVKNKLPEDQYTKLFSLDQSKNMIADVYEGGTLVYSNGTLDKNTTAVRVNYSIDVDYPYFIGRYEKLPDSYRFWCEVYENDTLYYYVYSSRTASFDVTVTLDESTLGNTEYRFLLELYTYRYTLIFFCIGFLLLSILLLVYLLCTAGRNRDGLVAPVGLSRMPLDAYCAASFCLMLLSLTLMNSSIFYQGTVIALLALLIVATVCIPLGLGFLYILAAQIKCKHGYWWKHTVCGWCLRKVCHFFRRCIQQLKAVFEMLPVIWQWLAIAFGMAFSLLISAMIAFDGFYRRVNIFVLVFLAICFGCVLMILYGGWCFGTVLTSAKKMSDGELDYRIPEEKLFGAFKTCAQQLNSLSGAAKIAAEKQLRSERTKTELITNVSHDIKTPLTSIINFVDLLEKPHTEEEGVQYLEVLSRQSMSLKKLIEDLMDLSKASTGNMSVNLTTLDAVEVANQAMGEFADKLEKAQLIPIVRAPEGPLPITADGRLVWRVLSNLLGNAVKYAAPSTRLYLELNDMGKTVQLSIRNISRDELNVSAEELLERFVQGDVSRNAEGSGLGLNIAKSLMEVQHGSLELTLDDDLFKVTLTFPKA